jgi:excisionase family DNA binding protein
VERPETYTPDEAAKILGLSRRQILNYLTDGTLEGEREANRKRWRVYQHSVHALRETRGPRRRRPTRRQSAAEATQEAAELRDRVEVLQRDLGRLEGRLQLTERAESTMQQERERLVADLERERERADRLEAELAAARRSWWQRLLGR